MTSPFEAQASRAQGPRPHEWRTIAACNVGVCLEGFDFIAYSAFSVIFAKLYFPAESALPSTLLTFGGFATTYLARPLGGLFWGIHADRHGRRSALAWTAILMALGTGTIALTPGYAAIGIVAPALILGAAPDLDAVFKEASDRDPARTFMDLLAAGADE